MDFVDVRVRAAEEGDLEVVAEFGYETAVEERGMGDVGYVKGDVELARAVTEYVVGMWRDPRYLFLVAEDEDVGVVGVLVGMLDTRASVRDPRVVGVIEFIRVLEEYRRGKVGMMLVGMFEGLAVREGVRKFEGTCYQANTGPQWGLLSVGYVYEAVRLVKYVKNPIEEGEK